MPDLPVVDQRPVERADAARSRRRLLAVAREIVTESGVGALSMDGLAARAGVGVGTVYRRFTDRSGLAFALVDSEEQEFQVAFMTGPPPLGPGAPPLARVRAFCHAYLDRLEALAEIFALGEAKAPTRRYAIGAYRLHRAHLVAQLVAAGHGAGEGAEPEYVAEVLLAMLSSGLFLHQRRERGMSMARLNANLDHVLGQILER